MRKVVIKNPLINNCKADSKLNWVTLNDPNDVITLSRELDRDPDGPPIVIDYSVDSNKCIEFLYERKIPMILVTISKQACDLYIRRATKADPTNSLIGNVYAKLSDLMYNEDRCNLTIELDIDQDLIDVADEIINAQSDNISEYITKKICMCNDLQPTMKLKFVKNPLALRGVSVTENLSFNLSGFMNLPSEVYSLMQIHVCKNCGKLVPVEVEIE